MLLNIFISKDKYLIDYKIPFNLQIPLYLITILTTYSKYF